MRARGVGHGAQPLRSPSEAGPVAPARGSGRVGSSFERVRGGREEGFRQRWGRRVLVGAAAGTAGLLSIPMLAHHPGAPQPPPERNERATVEVQAELPPPLPAPERAEVTVPPPPAPPPPAPPPPVDPALAMFGDVTKTWSEPAPGVRYLFFTAPGPHRVHVVEVDLTREEYALRTTRPEERGQTTSRFAQSTDAVVAINADFFSYGSYQPSGLTVTEGQHWPGTADRPEWRFLACDAEKRCEMDPENHLAEPRPEWHTVVGGAGASLIVDGQSIARGDPPHAVERHPRSAVGLTADGKMILVAAEGRRGDAIGMTYDEMSALLAEMRAVEGLMLDGGGSTTLVIDGERVNGLPGGGGAERAVSNHLAVVRKLG